MVAHFTTILREQRDRLLDLPEVIVHATSHLRGATGRGSQGRVRASGSTQTGVVEWPNTMNMAMTMRPIATPISSLRMNALMVRF
jgi:hypothetical protein